MIYCLVAVEKSQGIGCNNQMPWPHLKGDMAWFKKKTVNHCVIMGSNTWNSLPPNFRPLPNRVNAVISRKTQDQANYTFFDPVDAINELRYLYPEKDIYVIGGQQIYDSYKDLVDVFYVTEIDANYVCDKFFDLDFVKKNYYNVNVVSTFDATDKAPAYTIKEYKK